MIVGTSAIIRTTIEIDGGGTPDSVTIEVYFPDGSIAVSTTGMTDEGDNVYSYIYQSAIGDPDKKYKSIVTAVKGDYVGRSREYFILDER